MTFDAWISTRLARISELVAEPLEDLEAWTKYLSEEREAKPRTALAYTKNLLAFAQWWKQPLDRFGYKDAITYKTHVREASKNPHIYIYGTISYLKFRLCRHDRSRLFDRTYLPDVCRGLKIIKTGNGNGESVRDTPVLSIQEVEKLIEIAHEFNYANVGERDTCLIALLYSTGFRQDELVSMRTKDLFIEDGTWYAYCPRSKTQTRRVKILWGAEYAELAKAHRSHARPEDPLWMGFRGEPLGRLDPLLRRIVRRSPTIQEKFARAEKMAHLFRHTRATHLAHEWKDPWMLRDYFGWSSLDMANYYVARTGRQEPAEKVPPAKTIRCPVCEFVSIQAYQYCPNCGNPISDLSKKESPVASEMEKMQHRIAGLEKIVKELFAEKRELAERIW